MESRATSQYAGAEKKITARSRRSGLRWALLRAMACGAFLAAMWAPSLALGQPTEQNNEGLNIIPLDITNNVTTAPALFVYIVGIVPKGSNSLQAGDWAYVTDLQGNVNITPSIPVTAPISLGLNVGTGTTTQMMLPKLDALRIYLSLGNGLLVQTNSQQGAAPSAPCGWCGTGSTENDNNFNTIFDWAELAWTGDGSVTTMGGNTTQVDMFGLPLLLALHGNNPTDGQPTIEYAGFMDKRPTIMNAYANLGAPWTSLLLFDINDARMRAVAPYHGIAMGVFPANQLQSYIDSVWTYYASHTMTVKHSCPQDNGQVHSYLAQQIAGNLIFSENGVAKFQFPKPNTLTVYQNEIAPDPLPTDALILCLARGVAAKLGGAFVRTNLLVNTNLDACRVSQFYVNDPITKYAQIFHQFGLYGLAYSFGYDDTCEQSSYITVQDPTALSISISTPP